jgi:hypothetical protein
MIISSNIELICIVVFHGHTTRQSTRGHLP